MPKCVALEFVRIISGRNIAEIVSHIINLVVK